MAIEFALDTPAALPYVDYEMVLDAPVSALFTAFCDADLIRRWFGPRDSRMQIERWDLHTGGGYRFAHLRGPAAYWFRGVVHSARENELVIWTFEFEGYADLPSLEYLSFVDLGDDRCLLRSRSIFPTVEVRDATIEGGGLEASVRDSYERLDALLSQQAGPVGGD